MGCLIYIGITILQFAIVLRYYYLCGFLIYSLIMWFFQDQTSYKNSITLRMLDNAIIWITWLSFIQDDLMSCPWVIMILSVEFFASGIRLFYAGKSATHPLNFVGWHYGAEIILILNFLLIHWFSLNWILPGILSLYIIGNSIKFIMLCHNEGLIN